MRLTSGGWRWTVPASCLILLGCHSAVSSCAPCGPFLSLSYRGLVSPGEAFSGLRVCADDRCRTVTPPPLDDPTADVGAPVSDGPVRTIGTLRVTVLNGDRAIRTATGTAISIPMSDRSKDSECSCAEHRLRWEPASKTFVLVR